MLRPLSGKWRATWCVLTATHIEWYGVEKEKVREVVTTSQAQHTQKVGGKKVPAGRIELVRGVTCEWVDEGTPVE